MIIIKTGWSYSDLSHEAKLKGGPEKFVESIHKEGFIEGSLATAGTIAVFIGSFIFCRKLLKKRRLIKEENEMFSEGLDEKSLEELKELMNDESEECLD